MATTGKTAAVIGAGMGGLAAAGALARHFEHVIVLERDALPSTPERRPGVPQGQHIHALLASGQRALSELFPGFEQDLAAAGAVQITGLSLRFEQPGYLPCFPQRDFGWNSYALSRPALEFTVRRRVEGLGNVVVRQRCRARELRTSPDGSAVVGVALENADGASEFLAADLVVDASGRGALTLALLQATGRPAPEETVIGVDLGYSTRVFAIPPGDPGEWNTVMTFPDAPRSSRGAFLFPLEGERWIVGLSGRGDETPPGDADGFLAFTGSLLTTTIHDAIRGATALTGVIRYGFAESVWRHFERMRQLPHGLLPVADTICRFNPVYGQGMSVAALEACLLDRLLRQRADQGDPIAGLAEAFLAEVPSIIETPWSIANLDFVFPDTRGQRPPDFEASMRFGAALTRLAARDPEVHRLSTEVRNLLRPRSVYRDPALVQRVMAVMAEM